MPRCRCPDCKAIVDITNGYAQCPNGCTGIPEGIVDAGHATTKNQIADLFAEVEGCDIRVYEVIMNPDIVMKIDMEDRVDSDKNREDMTFMASMSVMRDPLVVRNGKTNKKLWGANVILGSPLGTMIIWSEREAR